MSSPNTNSNPPRQQPPLPLGPSPNSDQAFSQLTFDFDQNSQVPKQKESNAADPSSKLRADFAAFALNWPETEKHLHNFKVILMAQITGLNEQSATGLVGYLAAGHSSFPTKHSWHTVVQQLGRMVDESGRQIGANAVKQGLLVGQACGWIEFSGSDVVQTPLAHKMTGDFLYDGRSSK